VKETKSRTRRYADADADLFRRGKLDVPSCSVAIGEAIASTGTPVR
jgi:hypothetical protein